MLDTSTRSLTVILVYRLVYLLLYCIPNLLYSIPSEYHLKSYLGLNVLAK